MEYNGQYNNCYIINKQHEEVPTRKQRTYRKKHTGLTKENKSQGPDKNVDYEIKYQSKCLAVK